MASLFSRLSYSFSPPTLILSLCLTFARLVDDSLRLGLGGEQALDAVCSGADLHGFHGVFFVRPFFFPIDDQRRFLLAFLSVRERSCVDRGRDAE